MKRLFALAVLGICMQTAKAQPQLVDGVVAVVGKNIVLKSDIDKQYASYKAQPGADNLSKCDVFEDLLFEKLMLHQAEKDSITVSEEEVQATLDRRMSYYIQQIGSRQKLEQYYKKSIPEIQEELEPMVRDQMVSQRMLQNITGSVEVTPSEVREFYRSMPKDSIPLINSEVEYAQIVIYPEPSAEAKQAAKDKLNEFRQRVLDGSSFSTLAVLYSEDLGSAKAGGKYEGIKRGQFVPEFEAVAFNLQEGEISKPVKSEYGYHIIQLLKKRGEELDLRHILIKPKISDENLEASRSELDSVRKMILNGKLTFEEAAEKYSEDEDSKLNGGVVMNPQSGDSRWETGQLNSRVFLTLDKLEEGEISDAVFFRKEDKTEGFRLLKLIEQTEPHKADIKTDYQRLQQMAQAEKSQRVMKEWVSDKLKSTYVRVNNEYLKCEFQNNWIKKSQYVE